MFSTWILFKFDSKTKSFFPQRIIHTKRIFFPKKNWVLQQIFDTWYLWQKLLPKNSEFVQNPCTKYHQINPNPSKFYTFQSIWWWLVYRLCSNFIEKLSYLSNLFCWKLYFFQKTFVNAAGKMPFKKFQTANTIYVLIIIKSIEKYRILKDLD